MINLSAKQIDLERLCYLNGSGTHIMFRTCVTVCGYGAKISWRSGLIYPRRPHLPNLPNAIICLETLFSIVSCSDKYWQHHSQWNNVLMSWHVGLSKFQQHNVTAYWSSCVNPQPQWGGSGFQKFTSHLGFNSHNFYESQNFSWSSNLFENRISCTWRSHVFLEPSSRNWD